MGYLGLEPRTYRLKADYSTIELVTLVKLLYKIIINLTIILLSCYFYNIPKHDVDYKLFSNLEKK